MSIMEYIFGEVKAKRISAEEATDLVYEIESSKKQLNGKGSVSSTKNQISAAAVACGFQRSLDGVGDVG